MYYFTPGPTQAYPKLHDFLIAAEQEEIFSLSHRSQRFESLYKELTLGLHQLMDIPEGYEIFALGSATEAMERIVDNCIEHNSVHIVNGAFSQRFYDCAREQKKQARAISIDHRISEIPHIPTDTATELVAITHFETSIGMGFQEKHIRSIAHSFPNALVALDVVTSAPLAPVPWDIVDLAFFSVQKGFGLPAGLGIMIVGPRAMAKAQALFEKGVRIGTYHNFLNLAEYKAKNHTPETPNILGLYLLHKAIKDMLEIGISTTTMYEELTARTTLLTSCIENHPYLHLHIPNPDFRATTVTTLATPEGSQKLIDHCKKGGFVIGSGYGSQKDALARIANFPVHDLDHMEALIEVLNKYTH